MIKKLFFAIPTLALLLFGLVSPVFAYEPEQRSFNAAYQWTGPDSILSKDYGSFVLSKDSKVLGSPQDLKENNLFISTRLFEWETEGKTFSKNYWITVSKANPRSGTLLYLKPGTANVSSLPISIFDPSGVGPKPQVKITKGAIWAQLVKEKEFPEAVDFGKEVEGEWVLIETGQNTQIDKKQVSADGVVNKLSLDGKNFLYTGSYQLYFHVSQQGNCETGGTDGAGVCRIALTGVFNFLLEDAGNGYGKVIPNNPDDDEEKDINSKSLSTKDMESGPKLKMVVRHSKSNPVESVLVSALESINKSMASGIEMMMGWVDTILKKGNSLDDKRLENAWKTVRNLALGLLTLGIIIIAFANIVGGISLEAYGLNKMIPRLVIGVVMTYFSFLIARLLLEVASALQTALVNSAGTSSFAPSLSIESGWNALGAAGEILFSLLMFAIFLIILFVAVLWLCLVLLVRIAVIWFLVAVAPLAFLMQVLPFTESLYKQWWQRWWKWVFMGPAIAFMLWLTSALMQSYMSGIGTESGIGITPLILMAACIFIAASLPMTMGGEVFGGIQKAWGKYGNKIPGVKTVKETYDTAKRGRENYAATLRSRRARNAVNKISDKLGPVGAVATGKRGVFTKDFAAGVSAYKEAFKDLDIKTLEGRLDARGGGAADLNDPEVIALLETIAGNNHLITTEKGTKDGLVRVLDRSTEIKNAIEAYGKGEGPAVSEADIDYLKKINGVTSAIATNADKDANTRLYLHAEKAAEENRAIVGIDNASLDRLAKASMDKVKVKSVAEHNENDIKAVAKAVQRGNDTAKQIDKDIRKTTDATSQGFAQYDTRASSDTKVAHEKYKSGGYGNAAPAPAPGPAPSSSGGPQGPSSGSGDQWHL